MNNYRIDKRYPVYPGGGCIPYTGYFVQVFVPGLFKASGLTSKASPTLSQLNNY